MKRLLTSATVFFIISSNVPAAFAQSDTTPPTLASFSFAPSDINTTAAPQTVTVTMHLTDDLSGVQLVASVSFLSPSRTRSQSIPTRCSLGSPATCGTAFGRQFSIFPSAQSL